MNTEPNTMHRRHFLKTSTTAVLSGFTPLSGALHGSERPRAARISYCCDGRIYVGEPGAPEGEPLTTGHDDFKPSWSKTEDRLVCFRRTKNDPITANWKSAIFVINADGSGFHQLSDGTRTDFNPTWSRDGRNTPIWNRKNDKTGAYCVMRSKVGGKPGDEGALLSHGWPHLGELPSPDTGLWRLFADLRGRRASALRTGAVRAVGEGRAAPRQHLAE